MKFQFSILRRQGSFTRNICCEIKLDRNDDDDDNGDYGEDENDVDDDVDGGDDDNYF